MLDKSRLVEFNKSFWRGFGPPAPSWHESLQHEVVKILDHNPRTKNDAAD